MPPKKKVIKKKTAKKKVVKKSPIKKVIPITLNVPPMPEFLGDIVEKERNCKSLGHIQKFSSNFSGTYQHYSCDICQYSYYIDSSD